jgi:putative oxidoreductase
LTVVEYGLLLLRLVVGLVFVGHGSQKLFGWFGGGGPAGTAAFFSSLGYRVPAVMAIVVGLSELGGGLLLASGLLTPSAALLLTVVMLNAIATVVWPKGFLGGYEFELTLMTVALALTATGPGRISLDRAIGWDDELSGIAWASAVLGAAIVISLVTTTLGRASADLDELPG